MPELPSGHVLPPLDELVAHLRAAPAWQRKRDLELLGQAFAATPVTSDRAVLRSFGEAKPVDALPLPDDIGDDAAAIADADGYLLLAAEVM